MSEPPTAFDTGLRRSHTESSKIPVDRVESSAYRIPTDFPESDGTIEWDSTTLVLVEVDAGGKAGLGYTYADGATATLIRDLLAGVVSGRNAMDVPDCWRAMVRSIRNLGRPGICSMAISAVDNALWDLKAKILGVPLATLLGCVRRRVDVYGSGGFTSYPLERLRRQLSGWVAEGIPRVKMKVGREPSRDAARVAAAREAIGNEAELFVDANGAYARKEALAFSESFASLGVSWFEEPVPADDREGLRLLRDRAPAGVEIAAGEYGYRSDDFRLLLDAGAVDVLQADATRASGITGFLQAAALCDARGIPLSAHCAPSIHAHVGCAAAPLRHIEYFHDHARIERMLFEGALLPAAGSLEPDWSRPGLGLEWKRRDAERFSL
ncbi:MAG: mandelate racemase [Acidobacteriota bacterium]|nr:mandelate racemase [Acidobacteriota bacterium]